MAASRTGSRAEAKAAREVKRLLEQFERICAAGYNEHRAELDEVRIQLEYHLAHLRALREGGAE